MLSAVGYASVQAQVRARRSRLLDDDDWHRLFDAHGLERARDVLAGTRYTGVAADVTHAERTLRRRVHRETVSLADDVPPRARDLLRWHASRYDVQDIKLLVRALHYDRSLEQARAAMTVHAQDGPDVAAWTRARSLRALLEALDGSPYGRALANAWERYQAEHRPFYLEVALDLAFGRGLVKRIDALGGGDARDAEDLLGRWLARTNLLAAVRYRALAGIRPEEVVNFCLHRDFGGGLAMVQRVAAGAPLRDEAAALGVELPSEASERDAILELERRTEMLRRDAARARFARVPFGLGLVLAYLILLEAEVQDLIRLLEAKAQDLSADDLRSHVPREVT
ncbi:MAG: V-type ATPase subunit [Trueperaceae bacterium]|nr:V-type ATPase subunit [Trueperaceae bacterium]